MKIKPQYLKVGSEDMVVLSAKEYERLAKKADVWEPPMPERNERGNYPVEVLDVIMAQGILRARRKLGLSQAELARRAGVRVATLNRIEHGKIERSGRAMEKIDQALRKAQERNGTK
jgi:ribosome-binding protein aMBF1 (putative translation factor)